MASHPTPHAGLAAAHARPGESRRAAEAAAPFVTESGLVIAIDAVETVLHASDGWRTVFGEAPSRPVGLSLRDAIRGDASGSPDRRDLIQALRRALLEGPDVPIPLVCRTPNEDPRRLEGRVYRRPDCTLIVFHDVSARPHDGSRVLEPDAELDERRVRTEKLETLGVLAAGVAHDFSNLLTPIVGNASLLLADLPAGAPERRWAEGIRRAAARAASLTAQMLAYAGSHDRRVGVLDLSDVIRDVTLLVETTASKKSRIQWDLDTTAPKVHGDASQIAQIVVNLVAHVSNALGDDGGAIHVRTRCIDANRAMLDACHLGDTLSAGPHACIEVWHGDASTGMSRAALEFPRTRPTGRGLGLSVVLGAVRAHEGALHIGAGEDDEANCFRVLLPAATSATQAKQTRGPAQAS